VLGEVVSADTFGAIHGADLALAGRTVELRLVFLLLGEDARAEHPHAGFTVLQLALLVLHRYDDAGRKVSDAHRGVGGVDRLSTGTTRPVDVDLQVVL